MSDELNFEGVIPAVATPFAEDGAPDTERFINHCNWLLDEGCTGLLAFGSTGEANSLGLDERLELLEELVNDGIDPAQIMVGTGSCSTADAIILTEQALDLECGGVLTLPPFFYKNVTDEGLFRFYAEVIEGVGDDALRLYLYHMPRLAGVDISLELVERLVEGFPGIVVGMKDSSGDLNNMLRVLEAGFEDFEFFTGSEGVMLETLRNGAAGCISAHGNLNARAQRELFDNWEGDSADQLQERLLAFRNDLSAFPLIPVVKGLIGHFRDDPRWSYLRPPLEELPAAKIDAAAQMLRERHSYAPVFTIEV